MTKQKIDPKEYTQNAEPPELPMTLCLSRKYPEPIVKNRESDMRLVAAYEFSQRLGQLLLSINRPVVVGVTTFTEERKEPEFAFDDVFIVYEIKVDIAEAK